MSLDFFFGLRHYPIIPNIRWGSEELSPVFLNAIPKHVMIAVGTYGFIKTNKERATWKEFIRVLCEKLEPSGIVVYGSCPDSVFSYCEKMNIPVYQYESFKSKRMKEVH